MGYEFHIKRDFAFSLDEWKRAAASIPGLRLDDSPVTAINPMTGARITVGGRDGDVALILEKTWVKVFRFSGGQVSFNARATDINDPNDVIASAAFALAHLLSAKIVGDDGEEYELRR